MKAQQAHEIVSSTPPTSSTQQRQAELSQLVASLKDDGKLLLNHARSKKRQFEIEEQQCQEKIREFERKKQRHETEKRNLESKKSQLNYEHSTLQNVLSNARSQKSEAESSLRRAESRLRDEKEREERRLAVGGFGGAFLGALIGGPVGLLVGAAAGSAASGLINELEGDVDRAKRHIDRCQTDVNEAERNVRSKTDSLQSIEADMRSSNDAIQKCATKVDQVHKKIGSIKNSLAAVKDAITLWELMGSLSNTASSRTDSLQKIVAIVEREQNYVILNSNGTRIRAKSFLKAWEVLSESSYMIE